MSTQAQQAREQLEQILANPEYQQPTTVQDDFSGLNELKSFAQTNTEGINWLISLVVVVALIGIALAIWLYFRKRRSWQTLMQFRPQQETTIDLVAQMNTLAEQEKYRQALQRCYQYLLYSLMKQARVLKHTQTNSEHRQYIQNKYPQTASTFVKLSIRFDHIWYGQEQLTKQHFEQFREQVFLLLKEGLVDETTD